MNLLNKIIPILFLSGSLSVTAQTVNVEGYVFEENNRGYIRKAKVMLYGIGSTELINETRSDKDGAFSFELERGKKYIITSEKKGFEVAMDTVSTIGLKDAKTVFSKIMMLRSPGYIFDVTIAEIREGRPIVNAIDSARIEIYNNTNDTEELVYDSYPHPNFKFNFEPGNHYTLMIRRKGFFTKRVEAYIDVEGCILCFDGLGNMEPGVLDVMTAGNAMGTFLANIELQPLKLNKTFTIENIYYDYDKSFIRSDAAIELDKLVGVLKDNPAVIIELGSHTDSRGRDSYNMSLSDRRASAAVDYLVGRGVDGGRLTSRGYGESMIANSCRNGVPCSDENHERNRRTELKIIGISEEDPLDKKTLAEIIREEKLMQEVLQSEVIKIEEDSTKN